MGFLDNAGPSILQLGIVAIIGAITLTILGTLAAGFTGAAASAIANATLAISNFFVLLPTLGTILIAIVILGAVAALGYMFMSRR